MGPRLCLRQNKKDVFPLVGLLCYPRKLNKVNLSLLGPLWGPTEGKTKSYWPSVGLLCYPRKLTPKEDLGPLV